MNLDGWIVAYAVTSALVVIVTGLLVRLRVQVRAVGRQAGAVASGFADLRQATADLPSVAELNRDLRAAVLHAAAARRVLVGEEG